MSLDRKFSHLHSRLLGFGTTDKPGIMYKDRICETTYLLQLLVSQAAPLLL